MADRCTVIKKDGVRCGSPQMRGHKKCIFHIGNNASRLGRKGGMRRARYALEDLTKFDPPRDASDMRKLLATMVIEMREERIDPKLATNVAFVANVFLKSTQLEELVEVKARIAELEAKLGANHVRRH